jgi:hypothetical protein
VARVTGLVNVRAGPRSKRFKRRQIEALFDTAQPRFKFADQDAVADDGRMIFHDSAAETDHLLASLLVLRNGRASAARRSEATSARSDRMSAFNSAFMSHRCVHVSHLGAHLTQMLEDKAFRFGTHAAMVSTCSRGRHKPEGVVPERAGDGPAGVVEALQEPRLQQVIVP